MFKCQANFLHSLHVSLTLLLVALTHSTPVRDTHPDVITPFKILLLETFTEANVLKESCQKYIAGANLTKSEKKQIKSKKFLLPKIHREPLTSDNFMTRLRYVDFDVKFLLSQNKKLLRNKSESLTHDLIPYVENITTHLDIVDYKVTKMIRILKRDLNQTELIVDDRLEKNVIESLTDAESKMKSNSKFPSQNTRLNEKIEVVIAEKMENVMSKFLEDLKE
ncbi:hypothetical protein Btru_017158 [Bulinus truncatus]|nr:hypothetical protein Btru_017158 [Bulinus truncatus]